MTARDESSMGELTALLQHVHLPCWIFDEAGIFTWVNDAFIGTFGNLRGRHFSSIVAPERLDAATRHVASLHGSEPVNDYETVLVRADGRHVKTEVSSVLLEGIGLCCGAFGVAGVSVQPREGVDTDLTPRQLEVLQLLAAGASTDQIAKELFVSRTTVRNHIAGLLDRLGVHSRLAAVAKARREGLVDD